MSNLTINNVEENKNTIWNTGRFKGIKSDNTELTDLFCYSGLKKWAAKIEFTKKGNKYHARMAINEKNKIMGYYH